MAYCDPSFKSSSKNDYKAIKLWGKIGNELHHLKAFVRQASVPPRACTPTRLSRACSTITLSAGTARAGLAQDV